MERRTEDCSGTVGWLCRDGGGSLQGAGGVRGRDVLQLGNENSVHKNPV